MWRCMGEGGKGEGEGGRGREECSTQAKWGFIHFTQCGVLLPSGVIPTQYCHLSVEYTHTYSRCVE